MGLTDRIEALGGRVQVVSPPGNGTSLDITIPIDVRFADRVPWSHKSRQTT